jgi:hypothetical protein
VSRRDRVIVVWHEVPGKWPITSPSRRERCERLCTHGFCANKSFSKNAIRPLHKKSLFENSEPATPFPTGRTFCGGILAINCQATFIQSLRDNLSLLAVSRWSTPRPQPGDPSRHVSAKLSILVPEFPAESWLFVNNNKQVRNEPTERGVQHQRQIS